MTGHTQTEIMSVLMNHSMWVDMGINDPFAPGGAIQGAVSATELNNWYLLWAGVLVFFMQSGFAMLEAGVVQAKNVKNILMKNALDACFAALIWFLFGHGLAYGSGEGKEYGKFAGSSSGDAKYLFAFHIKDTGDDAATNADEGYMWGTWFFQFTFCAVAATIVSGAVAERCKLEAYIVYTSVITGVIYPIVVHWGWSADGAFSAFNTNENINGTDLAPIGGGAIDFAGSTIVHMTGGVAGLVGATILGPRTGRFVNGKAVEMPQHNSTLVALGTFILWVGWYGFNCGSTLGINTYSRDMARIAVTTTLAPAACGVTTVAIKKLSSGKFQLGAVCNGILAGLVSITAGCSVVEAYAAIIIGMVGAFVYTGASFLLQKLHIDDPLDAFAVHGACGAWGTLAVGLFATPDFTYNLKGYCGAFISGCNGNLFGYQFAFVLSVTTWVAGVSAIMFFILKQCNMFRVSLSQEEEGMDSSEHGGAAYDMSNASFRMAPVDKSKVEESLHY